MTNIDGGLLPEGGKIRGKRTKAEYTVERLLGEGAKGRVYLVIGADGSRYALKLGRETHSLAAEVECLRRLAPRIQRSKPFFVGSDEWVNGGRTRPFYVMAFVQGEPLSAAVQAEGRDSYYMTGYYLLRKLAVLHRRGYAFGDLKPSNVLVGEGGAVSLIDYGGVTVFGEPIRQCTELYDRASWQSGSRVADARYDLFAFALVYMQLGGALPDEAELPQMRSRAQLVQSLRSGKLDARISALLARMVSGEYGTAAAALDDWRKLLRGESAKPLRGAPLRLIWALAAVLLTLALFIYAAVA